MSIYREKDSIKEYFRISHFSSRSHHTFFWTTLYNMYIFFLQEMDPLLQEEYCKEIVTKYFIIYILKDKII